MAIGDTTLGSPRRQWNALAGLFDEAFRHGRKRQWRYAVTLLLGVAMTAATLFAAGILGASRGAGSASTKASTGQYTVCASDVLDIWRYTYGAGCAASNARRRLPYTYGALVLPAGSKVELVIAKTPIVHGLRIGGLGLTLHTETQSTIETSFRTPRAGDDSYTGECLMACGHDPEFAATNVTVVSPERYKRWVANHAEALHTQHKQAGQLRAQLIQQHVFAPNAPH